MKKRLLASAVALALGMCAPVYADTSSSIRGEILAPSGTPAANTKIIVTHIPTGVTRTFTTNSAGAFNARGLRVGGPYKITIDSDEYQDAQLSDVYLELGNPYIVRETLGAAGQTLVITGQRNLGYPNSGSSSTFGTQAIKSSASFNRDLKDVLKRNPLVNILDNDDSAISVAGSNPRFNSISVDGIRQDDDFGLNGSGYPTQRSSISIDAIEQISIATTPFSVKDGGFSGAKISVVTKSGTNEFKGSVFYEYSGDGLSGDVKDDNGELIDVEFTEKTIGFSLGGPIIKDKLFFYFNYEDFDGTGGIEAGPSDFVSTNPSDANTADANEVIRIANEVYGIDPGTWLRGTTDTDTKILFKLDWNISDLHRASLTYQNTDGEGTRGNIGGRTLNLSSNWYTRGDELTAYSVQLFSDWSSAFSTEIRVSAKDVKNKQIPLGGFSIGQVTVRTDSGSVEFGPDRSRHANKLSNDNFQFSFNGEYLWNDHTINFGWVMDKVDVSNLFIQNALGSWTFNGLDDFEDRIASGLNYQNAFTNNAADAAAEFSSKTNTLYIGDLWDITSDLTIQYGIRYERISTGDKPLLNANFVQRYGFENTGTLDGESIILPRLGFSWTVNEDLKIGGGIGKYSGGSPRVWLSNSYTNNGLTIVTPDLDLIDEDVYLTNVDISQVPTEVTNLLASGDGNTTPIDPNFEIPFSWQYSLKADYVADLGVLGEDWNFHGEIIYKDVDTHIKWIDLARQESGVTTIDGRPVYESFDPVTNNRDHYDLLLTNADGGESTILTFSVDKSFESGFDLSFSYTNQDVTDNVPGTSSTAESNYQFTAVRDRQNPEVATAAYEQEHRFVFNLDYNAEIFDGYKTTFGLLFERGSGRPYSWSLGAFRDRDFGDQSRFYGADSYLPYIPTSASDTGVDFDCFRCLSYDDIIAQLEINGISTAGGSLKRNDYTSPWRTNLDLVISQEIPGFAEDHKGEIYFTVDNLLNLIDPKRSRIYSNRFGENQQILFDYDLNAEGQYQYQVPFGGYRDGSPATLRTIESAWRLKLGVRYSF